MDPEYPTDGRPSRQPLTILGGALLILVMAGLLESVFDLPDSWDMPLKLALGVAAIATAVARDWMERSTAVALLILMTLAVVPPLWGGAPWCCSSSSDDW
jgi:hypothetical protein